MSKKATVAKKGKAAGGVARAKALSPAHRKQIAKKAAKTRWAKDIIEATHGSVDHPLKIGDIEIPCYVLEDETRVLSQSGVIAGLGMSKGGSGNADRLTNFLQGRALYPFISEEVMTKMQNPIKFRSPHGGGLTYGYPAIILADLCDAVLAARKERVLLKQQEHIAARCETLVRGFARVGIIALVDEATGYQRDRQKDALAKILEAFIAKELQPYVPTFPTDYYQEMFRLRGLPYPTSTVKRPQYFGCLTNSVIYDRLAPGVRHELQIGVPRNESGRPTARYFQKLTQNKGYPKLTELLGSVVTLMKLSEKWDDFIQKLEKFHPRYGSNLKLNLEYNKEEDSGEGL